MIGKIAADAKPLRAGHDGQQLGDGCGWCGECAADAGEVPGDAAGFEPDGGIDVPGGRDGDERA